MRDFNTAGPVRADLHYCVPPLERLGTAELLSLIRAERYFVLYAPRRTGKTSVLLALRNLLNGGTEGEYRCAYINVESARTAREDVGRAMGMIATEIAREAEDTLNDPATAEAVRRLDTTRRPDAALGTLLRLWTKAASAPLVLLIDETDALDAGWDQTRGQPWLVNALGRELCFAQGPLRPRDRPISEQDVFEARETLILGGEAHLDQLADKLSEPRVRRVIEPLLSGGDGSYSYRDLEYVRDLGLVAPDPPLRFTNPIYGEVVPQELT